MPAEQPVVAVDRARHKRLAAELPDVALLIGDDAIKRGGAGEHLHVNPATGSAQAAVPLAGVDDVDRAVAAARAAFPAWRAWRPDHRRDALLRLGSLIRRHADEIARILVLEAGTPLSGAAAMPSRAADYLEYYAGLADKTEGRVVPIFPERAFDYTLPEPYGVVAVLSTWNGGISAVARKAGAALAAGNTVVVKPMELAPFSTHVFGLLAREAGIPPGVVNTLPGGADAGAALAAHPDVDKISFTGGPDTARKVLIAAAAAITPVVLELGGKSGDIVFPDADLAAAGAFAGAACMRNSGQGCVMPTRLIVQRSVHDETVERAVAAIRAMPIGDPLDERTQIGPVVTEAHAERITAMVDDARRHGVGELLIGGGRCDGPLAEGAFVPPAVLDHVPPAADIAQREVFGPVLTVHPFDDEDEAVALANATPYGLAGYVHTRDLHRAHRVAAALDAGYVSLNGFAALPAAAPFGGFGGSGYGKEGGRAGLEEFVRTKNVYLPLG
ncbi:aldehyde dehydrogenase family protein [Yinghuangia seranimata]|uniref:aldehyde dehydrogenase family protein n=1 Tax=Yinghuangia seranimata TaxID=408067 RepID=UPI00248BA9E4|nr:aldehyde dehydrogenase family protein [Yinghuangia seranimata]MDI2129879.1 aldehyde dehydrogenase family protein [Yinghuangia seranimata]